MRRINKIFIANRGEIAVRIARTCQRLGISTVWPYCSDDQNSLVKHYVDQMVELSSSSDYLNSDRLIQLASESQCDAIHPGYGYLSENIEFAQKIKQAGLIFIGPSEKALQVMGDKLSSREAMIAASVPVVPGTDQITDVMQSIDLIGLPVLLKPSGGGGGKGMVVVQDKENLKESYESCRRQALQAFADDRIYMEKWIEKARHVEVQIMADQHGQVYAYGTRDCTVQRRHQKVIEECPAFGLSDQLIENFEQAAIQAARAVDYIGAGTVEFILTPENSFYFLEMNTRLQVEHPVTELVWGVDLVEQQIKVACGEPLEAKPKPKGHAIEARIYAEDPANQFLPCVGTVNFLKNPEGPFIRVDSGIKQGSEINISFDPMMMKICAWGENRRQAISRLQHALKSFVLHGVGHNTRFLLNVLDHKDFKEMTIHTRWLDEHDLCPCEDPGDEFWLTLSHAEQSYSSPSSALTTAHNQSSHFLQNNPFSFGRMK